MPERIFIGVAWPYANGPLHLGHIAGCYLPADIFARYHRLKGNEVLMVSGSDQHGTPITIRAEQEGTTPQEVVSRYHALFQKDWKRLGIGFDLFTTTGTDNHRQVAHDIFLSLLRQGYLYQAVMSQPYCQKQGRFLPDRYVEGTCPNCGNPRARGDQCEACGKPMNPQDLVGMRCRLCDEPPVIRETTHFFLKLSAFQDRLLEWARTKEDIWRPNVYNSTIGFLQSGLQDRAITRDIEWGVAVPVEGEEFAHKRLYVWFEAVIGYLSASKEWAQRAGQPERWRDFWQDKGCRSYYFIGKDNIPFHTIIWPAMLMGYSDHSLPYDVPANEFLTLEARKFSTSQNWAVWLPDYLERYAPDPLRYYLSAAMPETGDADFSWREFVRRNNDELVATYGNLAHRVLTFTYRNFDGRVPQPGALDSTDQELLARADRAAEDAGRHLEHCNFRMALDASMGLAQAANRYVDVKAPWRSFREDRVACATALWTTLRVLCTLKTTLYPFLPFSSQRLHELLGFTGAVEQTGWQAQDLPPRQQLAKPEPLFSKLDDAVVEEETGRLEAQRR
ncbi:MAG: methionine--tRNA ligase [Chloroflexi bacterium]|nr:methionine--tRNA ligase [Chloroflexota bacterium]